VILPAQAYSEKEATYVNLEGRAQITKRAVFAPEKAREDVEIFAELAKKLGFNLGFKNAAEVRAILAKEHPTFSNIDQITKAIWKKSDAAKSDAAGEILAKNYDFYLSGNAIVRASRILNKCSAELRN
jgi:NADH-quinone oxidoreductase subunit G